METLIGIVGKDFVLTATDMSAVQSIVVFKTDEDKSRQLTDHIVLAFSGEAGDTVQARASAPARDARLPWRHANAAAAAPAFTNAAAPGRRVH